VTVWWRLLVAAALGACGRIDFDAASRATGDAATGDAAPACTFGPWSTPQPISELETAMNDWGGQITGDGLTLYWSIERTLYVASRPDRQSPFGAASLVAGITGDSGNPSPTGDELELFYDSDQMTATYDVVRTTRSDTASAWSNNTPLAALVVGGVDVSGPYITPDDGLTLYYTRGIPTGTLMVSTRASTSDPFTAGTPVAGITGNHSNAALSADQLTIYFETGIQPARLLFTGSRPTIADPFGTATALTVNDTAADNSDVSITADGLELFFSSNRAGGAGNADLYVATRACQ